VSMTLNFSLSFRNPLKRYIIDNLPEGGQGAYGWDDGHGDD
jgi:hypothetical protein